MTRTVEIPEPREGVPLAPGPLAVSRDGRLLYVSVDYPDGCPLESYLGVIDTVETRVA